MELGNGCPGEKCGVNWVETGFLKRESRQRVSTGALQPSFVQGPTRDELGGEEGYRGPDGEGANEPKRAVRNVESRTKHSAKVSMCFCPMTLFLFVCALLVCGSAAACLCLFLAPFCHQLCYSNENSLSPME